MIHKTDSSLLNWIYKYVVDFTLENDKSGLTWNSTNKETLSFMSSIPKKEKVQKYGIYAAKSYLFSVIEFDDLKEGLENGLISEKTCKMIYTWNSEVERENWDMDDVMHALYPAFGRHISRNFLYASIKELVDLGVIECVNPKEVHGRMYIITEKGERVLGLR
ncbi:hypothetical protein [Methanobrevibacter sp.]|uniref:hypothetical protein n=1 Tax=Methanobrevibacter sp. TaxID=66852 RepID=UPI00386980CE